MSPRKARKTFTLDSDLVNYIEAERRQRSAESLSSALEQILRESKRRHEMQKVESAVGAYYDTVSDADRAEEKAWGKFSESQLPEE